MSTQEQRQQWRALEQAATPGEWGIQQSTLWLDVDTGYLAHGLRENDKAFIAAARAAVPALLADVDALTAERDALAAQLERVRAQLATVDDFGADCYVWGLDNKTWRPDFAEWSQWKREEAQPQA